MDYVSGGAGSNDIRATAGGTMLAGNAGSDVLRGGKGDDILIGGAGDDALYGGAGGDQFRFFGNQIEGASDTDRLYDLNFADGDTLVFGAFGGLFEDAAGVNAFNNGDAAIISSWDGLANAFEAAGARATYSGNAALDLLFITFDNGAGQTQTLRISNGYSAFVSALDGGPVPV
ncbi:calcium-binding protein [Sphingomonas turrisvirgatae]|uniref:Peptidase M10 serralysin C-terminal domain-containing protein n=1 Tax=Sphingomonas turrisvirgatae TaxID=1888892 RepID=A0A1E3LRV8_9SPHN|nr:calcium-binding protein [Sphingomonas turrisvirgatae]ODP36486.1 hypothetical protein BFL28_05730 [Sphingomonas turrisvirgatae]